MFDCRHRSPKCVTIRKVCSAESKRECSFCSFFFLFSGATTQSRASMQTHSVRETHDTHTSAKHPRTFHVRWLSDIYKCNMHLLNIHFERNQPRIERRFILFVAFETHSGWHCSNGFAAALACLFLRPRSWMLLLSAWLFALSHRETRCHCAPETINGQVESDIESRTSHVSHELISLSCAMGSKQTNREIERETVSVRLDALECGDRCCRHIDCSVCCLVLGAMEHT